MEQSLDNTSFLTKSAAARMANRQVNKSKEFHELYNFWRKLDTSIAFFALFGLLLGMVKYELDVIIYKEMIFKGIGTTTEDEIDNMDLYELAMASGRNNSKYNEPIKWAMFTTSMLSIILLIMRRYYELQWNRLYLQ